mmetsp:Transcript_14476/g.29851  ORF Transcript_14476/g.29851 Transcript_14476/m.29851 type:complete len:208 (-) Transcript_14476:828-1451(-)
MSKNSMPTATALPATTTTTTTALSDININFETPPWIGWQPTRIWKEQQQPVWYHRQRPFGCWWNGMPWLFYIFRREETRRGPTPSLFSLPIRPCAIGTATTTKTIEKSKRTKSSGMLLFLLPQPTLVPVKTMLLLLLLLLLSRKIPIPITTESKRGYFVAVDRDLSPASRFPTTCCKERSPGSSRCSNTWLKSISIPINSMDPFRRN